MDRPGAASILVVDDERGPRESLRMILEPTHRVLLARDGIEALEVLRTTDVDVVTLDLNMPGIQGEELMRTIRGEFPAVEVIVVTGYGTLESAAEGVRCGLADYIQKPFDVVQVSASVLRALERRRGRCRITSLLQLLGEAVGFDEQTRRVVEQVEHDPRVAGRLGELLGASAGGEAPGASLARTLELLEVLAETVERQSEFMRGHARRTSFYAGLLAERLCLSAEQQGQLRLAGFLHDIGKIGVPTHLLVRPGALDPRERSLVERHPEIGARLLAPLGLPTDVMSAVRHHHEWWDGRGYGDGLFGEQIPLAARIIAVADAYDAMTCDRPYRRALAQEVVCKELDRYGGVQFDPALAKEFLAILAAQDDLLALADSVTGAERGARYERPLAEVA